MGEKMNIKNKAAFHKTIALTIIIVFLFGMGAGLLDEEETNFDESNEIIETNPDPGSKEEKDPPDNDTLGTQNERRVRR